jgi:hypothetical protein
LAHSRAERGRAVSYSMRQRARAAATAEDATAVSSCAADRSWTMDAATSSASTIPARHSAAEVNNSDRQVQQCSSASNSDASSLRSASMGRICCEGHSHLSHRHRRCTQPARFARLRFRFCIRSHSHLARIEIVLLVRWIFPYLTIKLHSSSSSSSSTARGSVRGSLDSRRDRIRRST